MNGEKNEYPKMLIGYKWAERSLIIYPLFLIHFYILKIVVSRYKFNNYSSQIKF